MNDPTARLPVIHVRNSIIIGGVETTLVGWLKYFPEAGVDAVLCCFDNVDGSHRAYLEYLEARGLSARQLPWGRLKVFPMAVAKLVRLIRALPGCILHTHDVRSDFVGLMAARLTGTPLMGTCHAWHNVAGKVRALEAVDARLLRNFDVVTNVSEATRRGSVARGIPSEKALTLYSGIDLEPFCQPVDREQVRARYGLASDEFVFGNIARLYPEKGQHLLLHAAARLIATFPKMVILIAGEGPLQDELQSLARELGVTGCVRFVGFQHDLSGLLAALDAFVLPSLVEGTPMVIYSAMAMGVPIVASRIDGVAEVLEDERTAILVDPGDVEALIGGMTRLARRDNDCEAMGRCARQVVHECYSAVAATQSLAGMYRKLRRGEARQEAS